MNTNLPINLNECFGTIEEPLGCIYAPDTLTIIMIVRGEAKNIKAAVDSFRPVADEFVVNDTGSTDGTQAILDELGVYWFQSEWQDDFSLARNQALEAATCSWILYVDADDRLPMEHILGINRLKTAPLDRFFEFQIINTQAGGRPLGLRFTQARMFPNHPMMRFERHSHEQIVFGAARLGLHKFTVPATIYHLGYEDEETKKAKTRRNLRLAEMDKHLIGGDPAFTANLGDSYYVLEEWGKGIEMYKRAWNIPQLQTINRDIYAALPQYIGMGYCRLGRYAEALEWFNEAITLDPERPEPVYWKGKLFALLGKIKQAKKYYSQVLSMPTVNSAVGSMHEAMKIHARKYLEGVA